MDEKNDLINKSDKLDDGSEPKNDTSSLNSTQTANPDDGSVKSKHNADAVRAALHEARKKAVAKRSLAISAGRVGDDGTSNGSSTTSGDDNSGDADEISEIDEFVLANSDDIENDSKDSSALSDIQFVEPDEEENDDTDINTPPDYELYDIDANSDTEEETEAGKRPKKPSFRMKTRTFMQKYGYLGLAFLVPALTMWLIYIAMGTYPFGQGSVLVLDLNGQYVYYFEQLRKIVLGDQSWVYTFGRALGGEFMGIYAYYLASPFSFLVCLFPKQMITEALLLMFLLKTGCSGLTFGIYLHNKTEKKAFNRTAIVMFSTLYALTAYAVVQQHNTMWIDNLIMLPLIILGMERLIKRGRFKLFIITLTWAVMSNFYIGYMMCIFVFVYFFVCYFSMKPEERNPNFESAHFVKTLLRIGGCAVLVLGMSTVILWSAYYSLTFGKTTFSNPNYSFNSKFDLLDLVTKLFIGSYDTVRPEGLPFVYCGTITLLLLPLFFMIKKIPIREKIAGGFMTVFFVFCFEGSTIDIAWHGFQRPNWLNYRYSFMLCFFMVLMAYRAFIYIREVQVPVIIADCFFWVFVLVILQKYDYKNVTDYGTVWLSIAFFAIYLILLRFHVRSSYISGMSVAIAAIIVLEMFTAGLLNLVALDDDVVYSKRTSYRNFIDRLQPVVDMVKENDNSFYRMEKTVHRKTNDPLALGFRGLSNSTSTLNSSTIKFLNRLGLSSKSHWSKYLGGTPVLDTLLGLKYIIAEEDDSVSSLYELAYEYDPGEAYANLYAYKNPYALPIAYGVSEDLLSYNMESDDSPFDRMNQIISKMLGSTEKIEVFVPINIESTDTQYVNISYTTGHRI
ncbi:MAG TPA: YfhO family protein, partial [Bacillota bacterium]|nr:YfhO family protein [Bacillota bacterium]